MLLKGYYLFIGTSNLETQHYHKKRTGQQNLETPQD
jgi:hypothetical protein